MLEAPSVLNLERGWRVKVISRIAYSKKIFEK
jgi:hypothetical protein